ncbi:MAG TPA: hypothetical protein VJ953_10150 [Saprospiraceae bacterium]|nr:hypothetical protein [Saprospiraceae bacterium]
MKTKLFFGLLLALAFTACDVEHEKEITQPNVQPLIADDWSELEAADTRIEIFDHLGPKGSIVSGLQQLTVYNPDENRKEYFSGEEARDFYTNYGIEAAAKTEAEASSSELADPISPKSDQRYEDQPRKLISTCDGEECEKSIRQEIRQLQKIARKNCLSMVASFNCCQRGESQEIMVYLTPGVYCEREMLTQKRSTRVSQAH